MKYLSAVVGLLIAALSGLAGWKMLPPPGHAIDKYTEHLLIVCAVGIFFGALLIIPNDCSWIG